MARKPVITIDMCHDLAKVMGGSCESKEYINKRRLKVLCKCSNPVTPSKIN